MIILAVLALSLGSSFVPKNIQHGWVGSAVLVQDHGRLVVVFLEVEFEAVAVLGGVGAVSAAVLVHVVVTLRVAVQHGLVDTSVIALGAFERLGTVVVPQMVLKVVLVLGHEDALGTEEKLLWLDVSTAVVPEFDLGLEAEVTLLALELLDLALTVGLGCPHFWLLQVLGGEAVLQVQVLAVLVLDLRAALGQRMVRRIIFKRLRCKWSKSSVTEM